jgi:hypothetical protein
MPNGQSVLVLNQRTRKATETKPATAAHAAPTTACRRMPAPSGPGRVGEFEDAGGEDDRGGEQEGEAGGVFVVEAAHEPGGHADAVAADAGDQRG